MLFLELSDFLQVAEGFGFYWFGFIFVVEDGFEFFFFAEKGAHGFGVVESQAALLDSGMARRRCGFACEWISDLGKAELLAIDFRDPGGEIEGVNRLFRRVVEKVRDVQDSLFVFEDGFAAVECEMPDSEAFAE